MYALAKPTLINAGLPSSLAFACHEGCSLGHKGLVRFLTAVQAAQQVQSQTAAQMQHIHIHMRIWASEGIVVCCVKRGS